MKEVNRITQLSDSKFPDFRVPLLKSPSFFDRPVLRNHFRTIPPCTLFVLSLQLTLTLYRSTTQSVIVDGLTKVTQDIHDLDSGQSGVVVGAAKTCTTQWTLAYRVTWLRGYASQVFVHTLNAYFTFSPLQRPLQPLQWGRHLFRIPPMSWT